MSEEKVEIMRRATEAINRRDREAWLALADPEAEFRADPNWPESETVRGREAVWDITVSIADTWEQDPPVEIAEVIDAGDDRLVVRFKRPVRGKASGVETEFDYWWVGTFRSGRILRNWWFADRKNALEAAGLSE
jgi:ketosteroid isomerase-like protein